MTTIVSTDTERATPPLPARKNTSARRGIQIKPEYYLVPLVFVIVVGVWTFAVTAGNVPTFVLPTPLEIFEQLIDNLTQPLFWRDLTTTLVEVLLGYLIGAIIAISLGSLIAEITLFEKSLLPYVIAFQAVPSVTLAPLFVLWFGYDEFSKILMSALIAFFPILVNVIAGLKSYNHDQVQMLRSFGASRTQVFLRAKVPNSLPYVFAGLDTGIVLALIGAVVGEFVGAKQGLGARILQYNYQFNIAGTFAVIIVLAAMGLCLHTIVRFSERRLVFWANNDALVK